MILNMYGRCRPLNFKNIMSDGRFYWLHLPNMTDWSYLTREQRLYSMKFGAVQNHYVWYHGVAACPEFESELNLRRWLTWLLLQNDLDERLREKILSMVRK